MRYASVWIEILARIKLLARRRRFRLGDLCPILHGLLNHWVLQLDIQHVVGGYGIGKCLLIERSGIRSPLRDELISLIVDITLNARSILDCLIHATRLT